MFGKHIAAIKENLMNLTEMISFFEEGYSVVQALEADGTITKLEAAEAAIQSELSSNANVQKLVTMVEAYFTKKAAATAAQAPSGATS
jgi:hypothetical protein